MKLLCHKHVIHLVYFEKGRKVKVKQHKQNKNKKLRVAEKKYFEK